MCIGVVYIQIFLLNLFVQWIVGDVVLKNIYIVFRYSFVVVGFVDFVSVVVSSEVVQFIIIVDVLFFFVVVSSIVSMLVFVFILLFSSVVVVSISSVRIVQINLIVFVFFEVFYVVIVSDFSIIGVVFGFEVIVLVFVIDILSGVLFVLGGGSKWLVIFVGVVVGVFVL